MAFVGLPPETRVKLVILRNTLHKTFGRMLEEMVDTLWEAHKDDIVTGVSPHKIDDVFAIALKVTEQKAPYDSEGRKLRKQRRGNIYPGIQREVRPIPIPKSLEE